MSAKVMGAVFERFPEGGGLMMLALAIADHAWDDGSHVFAAIASLAAKTRQSARAVQYQLRKLELMGWLELASEGGGGRGRFREYRVSAAWLKGANLAPFSGAEPAPAAPVDNDDCAVDSANLKGAKRSTKGCNPRHPYITLRTINTPLPPNGGARVAETGKPEPASAAAAAAFARLWAAYPRKVAEAKAFRAFARLAPDGALLTAMLAALAQQVASEGWQREGGRYVPLLARWLREERWRDRAGIDGTAGEWWLSHDGIAAMGREIGLPWDTARFDACLSVADRHAYQRAYRAAVFERAGPGPWVQQARVAA